MYYINWATFGKKKGTDVNCQKHMKCSVNWDRWKLETKTVFSLINLDFETKQWKWSLNLSEKIFTGKNSHLVGKLGFKSSGA